MLYFFEFVSDATSQLPEYNNHVDQVLWVVNDLTNTMTHWANLGFNQVMDMDTVDSESEDMPGKRLS